MQEDQQPSSSRRSGWRTFGLVTWLTVKWLCYLVIFVGLLTGGAVTGYVASLVKGEEVRPRTLIEEKINENSVTGFVFFNDDTLIGQLRTEEDRILVDYDELPPQVINAVLAIEDNNFETHYGVDVNGLGRAVKQKLLNEDTQTGGSTLTQQLARRVFLSLDVTDSRKVKEIFLALRMERYLTKEEILAAYLNKVPFGNGSSGYNLYGIKAAAKGVFGITDLSKLNIAQSAYLAGLPQRPSAYTAFNGKGQFNEGGFDLAIERQATVLMRMLQTGRITQQEYDQAKKFDIRGSLAKPVAKAYTTYPYLMLEAERQAAEVMLMQQDPTLTIADLRKKENADLIEEAREHLLRGGYQVHTTIDKDIYKMMRDIGNDPSNFTPDSKEKGIEQIAAVLVDHKTGAILSMLEGRDFYEEQMNFATQMTRQPGSTMKPIAAYLPAIDKGLIQPASVLDDAPIILKNSGSSYHIPKNANNRYSGLVTAREALNRSLNLPALKIFLDEVTIKEAWKFTRKLGITTLQPEDDAAQTGVLGGLSIGVSVEELTSAYGSIPNQGLYNDSYMIAKITDANGKIVYEHQHEPTRVFSEQTAFLMTDMLRTVISSPSGTANSLTSRLKNYGKIPYAGKTGSTQNYGDVWFMGFTPDVTLGVWAGYEKPINTLEGDSRKRAREIWAKMMNQLADEKPEMFATKAFNQPDGVVKATVSSASGKLPTALTRSAGMLVTDWFNKKYIPKQADDALVNRSFIRYNGVNYVAQDATPSDFISQQTVIKRKKPLDELMDEISKVLSRVPASSRRALSYYLPTDAGKNAPSKVDPRKDDGSAPSAPGNVSLISIGQGVVSLSFSAPAQKDVVGFRLYQAVNEGSFNKVGNSILLGDTYSASFTVSASNGYSFYVTAVDVAGKESAPSQTVRFGKAPVAPVVPDPLNPGQPPEEGGDPEPEQGPDVRPTPETGLAAPAAPAGLSAQGNETGVTLSWQASAAGEQVTVYHVYFAAGSDGKYVEVGSTAETSFVYASPLTSGAFYVTAENAAGQSAPSSKASIGG